MRHVPNLKDFSAEELLQILDKAAEIKANPEAFRDTLAYHSIAMLFQKTSTRTRVSFEAGATELGGHAIFIDWSTSNFILSGIEHETEYLSRNVSFIMARLMQHEDLLKIISASQVPVINGCCERFHPCQALTDVMTMREHTARPLDEIQLCFLGVQNNVSNSLVILCDKLDIGLTLATPDQQDNGESADGQVQEIIKNSSKIRHTTNPVEAVANADFVYTDTWIDMQYFNNPDYQEENEAKLRKMMPYQLNKALLEGLSCKIMHDMPIHDGFEIEAGLAQDERSIIYQQAENRMHAQKGLLCWLHERR